MEEYDLFVSQYWWIIPLFGCLIFCSSFLGSTLGLWIRKRFVLKDDRVKEYRSFLRSLTFEELIKEVHEYGKK